MLRSRFFVPNHLRAIHPNTKTFRTPAGPLAYTDAGTGPPIVFLHGNPTSARLYRHLIRDLGLSNITLVLHDWGGPIGLAYALRHSETVRRLVLMNTWAWPLTHRRWIQLASGLLATPPGRLAVERLNAFARVVMPATTGPDSPLYPDWIRAYAAALNTQPRRHACWAYARALRSETDWLRALWTRRDELQDIPTLLCWGEADPAFGHGTCLRRWQQLFRTTEVHRFSNVGHYVPEETGPALVDPVRRFLQTSSA